MRTVTAAALAIVGAMAMADTAEAAAELESLN
jgi:hypothetical protein